MTQTIPQNLATDREAPAPVGSQSDGSGTSEPNLRDDIIVPCNIGEEVLAHAPDAAKPFFRVPRVIER
jgi:Asp-tRNA(Asn)/Glu-tRNA(Gln) amidotransferase C subunit